MHISCIICSDLINGSENVYFTKCGHVFHYHCLSQWIERSKSCPQCRNKVTEKCLFRVYFNVANCDGIADDVTTLQSKLDNASFQVREKDALIRNKEELLETTKNKLKQAEDELSHLEQKYRSKETALDALKQQFDYIKVENKELVKLRNERDTLAKSINVLQGLQRVLNETTSEVEQMLETTTDITSVCTFATALKRALVEAESKKNELRSKLQSIKTELSHEKKMLQEANNKNRLLQERLRLAVDSSKRKFEDHSPNVTRKLAKLNAIVDTGTPNTTELNSLDKNVVNNDSLNTLINKIESSDSPYLTLKQSNVTHRNLPPVATNLKPSEVGLLKSQKILVESPIQFNLAQMKESMMKKHQPSTSILKHNRSIDLFDENSFSKNFCDTSYDGFGGHSKPDMFPIPLTKSKSPMKSYIPKLTAKHKLKRPEPQSSGSNITKYITRMNSS